MNGSIRVNPRGYPGGQGWLWWALTAEADHVREVAKARAEQEYAQAAGRAEGAAITAELAAHAEHGSAMAQAGLEAASLTASAVNDHVKAVTEICTARAKALAQEAKDAAQAASDPLLAQLRAWRDAQGTRYASLVVAVAEARVAAWRGGIDVAADVAERKAIAGITAWGRMTGLDFLCQGIGAFEVLAGPGKQRRMRLSPQAMPRLQPHTLVPLVSPVPHPQYPPEQEFQPVTAAGGVGIAPRRAVVPAPRAVAHSFRFPALGPSIPGARPAAARADRARARSA